MLEESPRQNLERENETTPVEPAIDQIMRYAWGKESESTSNASLRSKTDEKPGKDSRLNWFLPSFELHDGGRKSGQESGNDDKPGEKSGTLSAEKLASDQEETARAWGSRGYGSEAITATLVKNGFRAAGSSKEIPASHASDSRHRSEYREFGRNSSDLIDSFKKDSRFELVKAGDVKEGDLKRGDLLVWTKDSSHPYGLSKVYLGNGRTASDHASKLADEQKAMKSGPFVFRLKEIDSQGSRGPQIDTRPNQDNPDLQPRIDVKPDSRPQPDNSVSRPGSVTEANRHLSSDPSSADYLRFKSRDGSRIIDLREIAGKGFPRQWDQYENAPQGGFNSVKDHMTDIKTGKGKWDAEMERRFPQLKTDSRMHYCMMVDGKIVAESKDAAEPQEGASTTKAIISSARRLLAAQQGKELTDDQRRQDIATLTYSINAQVRNMQKDCSTDAKSDPAGTQSVMSVMSALGISEKSKPTWGPNKLSPRDGASFMDKVMTDGFEGARETRKLMEMCKTGSNKMIMTAPEGIPVAHKTGTYNGNNDMGGCIVRGADGNDHVVTFCCQTKMSAENIGVLFGGLLRERGLTGKPSSHDYTPVQDKASEHNLIARQSALARSMQSAAGNLPLSDSEKNNLLQSIGSDRDLCKRIVGKNGELARAALETALGAENKQSLNDGQLKKLEQLKASFNVLCKNDSVKIPLDQSSQHQNDRDVRAKEKARIVEKVAKELGVDPVTAVAAMLVESGGNPRAVGDNGTSFGLFQLHKGGELDDNIYHRSLSREEAFDPEMNARVALSVFKQNQDRYKDPGVLAARSQRPADQEGYARLVNANLSVARRLLAGNDGEDSTSRKQDEGDKNTHKPQPTIDNQSDKQPVTQPEGAEQMKRIWSRLSDAGRRMIDPHLLEKPIESIDQKYPFDMNSLKPQCQYDRAFVEGREDFKRRQSNGQAPSLQELYERAKAVAPDGQRFFEVSVPYWVSKDGSQAVGQNYMFDANGKVVSENYWRRGGGDQLGHGKDVTIYHNIEGVNAGGSDAGWINQSANESVIARGGNPPVDMHGRGMSSGTSAGCEAHPYERNYQNWLNFRDKMHYAILDNMSRGLRPFATLHIGFEYAVRSSL